MPIQIVPPLEETVGKVFTVIANVLGVELPQSLFAVTDIFPLVVLAITVIEDVVEVPVHPEGSVHVKEVAQGSTLTEYIFVVLAHGVVVPVIMPGCDGALEVLGVYCKKSFKLLPNPVGSKPVPIYPFPAIENPTALYLAVAGNCAFSVHESEFGLYS